jgi:FtsH-binding integral membrane protein
MSYPSPYEAPRRVELDYATDEKSVFNFFNTVYAWMCAGLAITATTAYLVSMNVQLVRALHGRGIAVAVLLGSVLIVWGIRSAAHKISPTVATILFMVYAAMLGAVLSGIFIVYRMQTIGGAFAITAGTFGAMSIYGFVTKRDLTAMGSFLFMAVIGLFIATLVNIFMASTVLFWIINYVGVIVFTLLTAYDTQKLKNLAYQTQGDAKMAAKYAIIGALELYLDFLNMFLFILRIMGSRR